MELVNSKALSIARTHYRRSFIQEFICKGGEGSVHSRGLDLAELIVKNSLDTFGHRNKDFSCK